MAKMLQQEQIISQLRGKNTHLQDQLDRVVEDNELYYQKMKELERAKANLWRDFQVVKQAALLRRDQLIRTTRELMRVRQAKLKLARDLRDVLEELDTMKSEGGELDSDSDRDDHHDFPGPFSRPIDQKKKGKKSSSKSTSSSGTFISKSTLSNKSSSKGHSSYHTGGTNSLPSSRRQSYADNTSKSRSSSTTNDNKPRRRSAAPRGRRRSIGRVSSAGSSTTNKSGGVLDLLKLPKKKPIDMSQRAWLDLQKKAGQARRAAIQEEKRRKAQQMKLSRQQNKTMVERQKQMEERRKRGQVKKFKHETHSKLIGRMIDKQEKRNNIADLASMERQKIKEKIERDVKRDVELKRTKIAEFLQDVDNRLEERLDTKIRTRDEVAASALKRREELKQKIELERVVEESTKRENAKQAKQIFEERLAEIKEQESQRTQQIIEDASRRREAIKKEIEDKVEEDMKDKAQRVMKFKEEISKSFSEIERKRMADRDEVAMARMKEKAYIEALIEKQRVTEIKDKREKVGDMRSRTAERQKEIELEINRRRREITDTAQKRKEEIAAKIEQIVDKDLQRKRELVTAHKFETSLSAEERERAAQEARDEIAAAAVQERLALEQQLAQISDEELAKNRELVNMQKALNAEKERERIELYKQLLTDLDEDFIQYTPKNALEIARAIEELQESRINQTLFGQAGGGGGMGRLGMGSMGGLGMGGMGGMGYGMNDMMGLGGADPLWNVDGLGPNAGDYGSDSDVSLFDTRRLQRGNTSSPRNVVHGDPRRNTSSKPSFKSSSNKTKADRRSSARPRSGKKSRRTSANPRTPKKSRHNNLSPPVSSSPPSDRSRRNSSNQPTTPKKKGHHKRTSTLTKLEQLKAKLEKHQKKNDESQKNLMAQASTNT